MLWKHGYLQKERPTPRRAPAVVLYVELALTVGGFAVLALDAPLLDAEAELVGAARLPDVRHHGGAQVAVLRAIFLRARGRLILAGA